VKVKVPRGQWVEAKKPDLEIISESFWRAAHDRIDDPQGVPAGD
jgi:hypothetical protein